MDNSCPVCRTSPVSIPDIRNNRIIDSIVQIMNEKPVDAAKPSCPVCFEMVEPRLLEEHVNCCIDGKEASDEKNEGDIKQSRMPLPKLCYPLVSDKQLRKILKDLGLPTNGDKQALIKRHSDYILLYNSECNSSKPLSLKDIRSKVFEGERIRHSSKKREFSNEEDLERHGIEK